jgi:hypothetical protein
MVYFSGIIKEIVRRNIHSNGTHQLGLMVVDHDFNLRTGE